jgi:membrane fusion protein (multidrug efflux system)
VRHLIAIGGVILLLGALAAIKWAQISTLIGFGEDAAEQGPPPEAVAVEIAKEQAWETTISAIGSLASERGVAISTQVPGVVSRIAFESGEMVKKGDVIVELDSRVERAELASAKAREELAVSEDARVRSLVPVGAAPQAELDAAQAELQTARGNIEALRARIALKTIRAPFSGRLGIRQADLGQYLSPGTTIAILETTDTIFVDFTLPQERLKDVGVGMPLRLTIPGEEPIDGTIDAVEPAVDAATRSIRLRALVRRDDAAEKLRAGMFVDVEVVLPEKHDYVTVPATAIVHAPYGDSVFIVEDKPEDDPGLRETEQGDTVMVVRQQFVRTGPRRGDFVAVLEGVEAGEHVVSAGALKLRNRAPVFVTDTATEVASLDPRPENR